MRTPNTAPRVLIVGAGIAGLVAGRSLRRLGWDVEIVERRAGYNGTATGLFIPANGMRALRTLGMADGVIARGRAIKRLEARTADGGLSASVELERVWPGIGECVAVQRALALEALLESSGATVRMGTSLAALEPDGDAVHAQLWDGTSGRFDLVVGADGVGSTVRRWCWPGATPAYGGEVWWRGVVDCPPELDAWTLSMCAAGNFLVIPIGGGMAYWTGGYSTGEYFRDPVKRRAKRVRECFDDLQGTPRTVLEQITDDHEVQFSPAEQVWVDDPTAGRVVLVGDAWHATTPNMAQGASLAAEDALVLAHELERHGAGRIDAALCCYARRRHPRTRHVQQATAARNRLAALPLRLRSHAIARWQEISIGSVAPLIPEP